MSPNAPLDTPIQRFIAWLNMHWVDHGFIRVLYNNFYLLGSGMYRCSQPSPKQIAKYHRQYGIKSIVNLRGPNPYGSYPFEKEICQKLGIALIDSPIYSRRAPRVEEIESLALAFRTMAYPALMHCKSGADRAGIGSALYRMLHLGHSAEDAIQELDWRYGHFKQAKTGVLDFFLATYIARNRREPIAFMDWLHQEYDYQKLEHTFQTEGWANLLIDNVLRRE
jgi:protein tyrosine phosphatase (PTP) superfamily phosphohydrolase (DUF442 family)